MCDKVLNCIDYRRNKDKHNIVTGEVYGLENHIPLFSGRDGFFCVFAALPGLYFFRVDFSSGLCLSCVLFASLDSNRTES